MAPVSRVEQHRLQYLPVAPRWHLAVLVIVLSLILLLLIQGVHARRAR